MFYKQHVNHFYEETSVIWEEDSNEILNFLFDHWERSPANQPKMAACRKNEILLSHLLLTSKLSQFYYPILYKILIIFCEETYESFEEGSNEILNFLNDRWPRTPAGRSKMAVCWKFKIDGSHPILISKHWNYSQKI